MEVKLLLDALLYANLLLLAVNSQAPGPECRENSDCPENTMTCSGNKCQCGDQYVLSANWNRCLPTNAVAYDNSTEFTSCTETVQCSARLGPGALCRFGQCVCDDGYHYLGGECHKSSVYGSTCDVEADCFDHYSYEAYTCNTEKKCTCADGFYLVKDGYSLCRRHGTKVGDECFFEQDCDFENGLCNSTSFTCDLKSSTRISVTNPITKLVTVALTDETPTNATCSTSAECIPEEKMECLLGMCVCKKGYSSTSDNYCKKDLGESCTGDEDCSHIEQAVCGADKTCRCKLPYVISEDNRSCRRGRVIGINCQSDEQCEFYGGNAKCVTEGYYRRCQCESGYHNVDWNMCVKSRAIGEECVTDVDCVVSATSCLDGLCTCNAGFHTNGAICVQNVQVIGDSCVNTVDCSLAELENTECLNSKCVCSTGYFAAPHSETNIASCMKGVSAPCDNDTDCVAEDSVCSNTTNTCDCWSDGVASLDNSKCLPVRTYSGSCDEDKQCTVNLGERGAFCSGGSCSCKEGYHYRNYYCWETKYLGSACGNNSQCYINTNPEERVFCENGFCTCGYAYESTEDLDCRSGAETYGSSLTVTGVCLVVAFLAAHLDMRVRWTAGRP